MGAELTIVAALCDALVRVIRAAEFVEDGEVEEALQTLLDLERELWARLRREGEA
jgi:hypothetical protein